MGCPKGDLPMKKNISPLSSIQETENSTQELSSSPENPEKIARRYFRSLSLRYFTGTLFILVLSLLWFPLITRIPFIRIETADAVFLYSSLPLYLIAMPFMIFLIQRIPAVSLPKHSMTFFQWIQSFFMCYAMMYLSNLAGLFCTWIIGLLKGSGVENSILTTIDGVNPLPAFFVMVLCAPVFEELIFRKLLIDRTVKYGEGISILFSALFFGLFHGNLNQFAYAFTLGAFFAFIYVKTGKILYTIFLHMVVNFLGSIAGILLLRLPVYKELSDFSGNIASLLPLFQSHTGEFLILGLYSLMIFTFFITGIICLAVNARKMKLKAGETSLSKSALFRAAFLNIGTILFSLSWIIQIILQLLL